MVKLTDIFKKARANWYYRRAMRKMTNRNIKKATFLYYYIILGASAMFVYACVSLFLESLPFVLTFTPLALAMAYLVGMFLKKNWKMIWVYIKDTDQGKLLFRLNDYTHFEPGHKLKLLNWVYLKRKTIRNERMLFLTNKSSDGTELSDLEKSEMKCKVVTCPQQLLDGINKAILVDILIYAHQNIRILDDNIREIMELTDDNIMKFDLRKEIDRCRTKEREDKIERLKKIGMEKLKQN